MRKRSVFLALTATFTLGTGYGQKQRLEFNLVSGQVYYHNLHSKSVVQEEWKGRKLTVDAALSGKIAYKVMDRRDTVYKLDVTYQQLSMTLGIGGGNMTFNSDKHDKNDIFSSMLGAITGKTFQLEMNKWGKIIKVSNLDEMFDQMVEQFPQLSPVKKAQMKKQLMDAFGEKGFKGSFEMATSIYPDHPVEKGNTWVIKTRLSSVVPATLVTTYQLKEKTDVYNLISGTGIIESDEDSETQMNGMPAKYDIKGTMNSILKVDRRTGWVIDSKTNQALSGDALIEDNPKMPGGMKIPLTVESDFTYGEQ